jgi:hypothetical protein
MNDYLGNLAAKNLGLAAVIQPRLALLFEPAHPFAGRLSLETAADQPASDETPSIASSKAEPAFQSPRATPATILGAPVQQSQPSITHSRKPKRSEAKPPEPMPVAPAPAQLQPAQVSLATPAAPLGAPIQQPDQPSVTRDRKPKRSEAKSPAPMPVTPTPEQLQPQQIDSETPALHPSAPMPSQPSVIPGRGPQKSGAETSSGHTTLVSGLDVGQDGTRGAPHVQPSLEKESGQRPRPFVARATVRKAPDDSDRTAMAQVSRNEASAESPRGLVTDRPEPTLVAARPPGPAEWAAPPGEAPSQAAMSSEPRTPAPATSATARDAPLPATASPSRPTLLPTVRQTLVERIVSSEGSGLPSIVPAPQPGTISPAAPQARTMTDQFAAEPPVGTPAPQPAPTVHVTIGRIEVRAITPPAPPAPSAAPPKPSRRLSLDDYLKQRAEGR